MIGKFKEQNLLDSFKRNKEVVKYLEGCDINLTEKDCVDGDFVGENLETYELKYDPHIGKSGNVMIELFASVNRDNFEFGWAYRYKNTDFLIFFNEEEIYCYDCNGLLNTFWEEILPIKKLNNLNIIQGVKGNKDVVLILLKEEEVNQNLKWKIKRI